MKTYNTLFEMWKKKFDHGKYSGLHTWDVQVHGQHGPFTKVVHTKEKNEDEVRSHADLKGHKIHSIRYGGHKQ